MNSSSISQLVNSGRSIRTGSFRIVATAMAFVGRRNITPNWLPAPAILLLCGLYHAASATPVVEIIDGASWDLPIGETANIFLQRGWYQSSGTRYNANGSAISGPSTTEYIGLPSFAHFFFLRCVT